MKTKKDRKVLNKDRRRIPRLWLMMCARKEPGLPGLWRGKSDKNNPVTMSSLSPARDDDDDDDDDGDGDDDDERVPSCPLCANLFQVS